MAGGSGGDSTGDVAADGRDPLLRLLDASAAAIAAAEESSTLRTRASGELADGDPGEPPAQ